MSPHRARSVRISGRCRLGEAWGVSCTPMGLAAARLRGVSRCAPAPCWLSGAGCGQCHACRGMWTTMESRAGAPSHSCPQPAWKAALRAPSHSRLESRCAPSHTDHSLLWRGPREMVFRLSSRRRPQLSLCRVVGDHSCLCVESLTNSGNEITSRRFAIGFPSNPADDLSCRQFATDSPANSADDLSCRQFAADFRASRSIPDRPPHRISVYRPTPPALQTTTGSGAHRAPLPVPTACACPDRSEGRRVSLPAAWREPRVCGLV